MWPRASAAPLAKADFREESTAALRPRGTRVSHPDLHWKSLPSDWDGKWDLAYSCAEQGQFLGLDVSFKYMYSITDIG